MDRNFMKRTSVILSVGSIVFLIGTPVGSAYAQTGNTPPSVSIVSPDNGSTLDALGMETLTAAASDSNGILKVEFYRGTTYLGVDTTEPYTHRLSTLTPGTYTFTAKAYDRFNASAVSAPLTLTFLDNRKPSVVLGSPADGSSYIAPATITISATASDFDGISKVDFYIGTTLIGSDTTKPYSITLNGVPAGIHTYSAKAYDTLNISAVSGAVRVTVSEPNAPPVVSLTAPVNNSSFVAPAAITLSATASDSNGIARVEFYSGATLLGADTTSPYTWPLSNVSAGAYSYTARAFDTLGASTASAPANVTVTVGNSPPAIGGLTASPQTLYDTATSSLLVVASDPDDGPGPLTHSWSIVSGGGSLGATNQAAATYTPPDVSNATPVVIKVVVSDGAASVDQSITLTVEDAPAVVTETITYYHNDALGSPVAATDASGTLLWRETYRPYGERLNNQSASSNNPIWYTGKRQDPETGLVYMGSRYYDPRLGRFLSIDPVEPDENNL
ncbi:MAG: Ig-like domain-containing protein, partial [Pseudomonadota bacterium]